MTTRKNGTPSLSGKNPASSTEIYAQVVNQLASATLSEKYESDTSFMDSGF